MPTHPWKLKTVEEKLEAVRADIHSLFKKVLEYRDFKERVLIENVDVEAQMLELERRISAIENANEQALSFRKTSSR